MEAPDSLLENEPDFLTERFLQARGELVALNVPEDTITNAFRQAWIADRQARHEAWEARRRQDGPPQDDVAPDPIVFAHLQPVRELVT